MLHLKIKQHYRCRRWKRRRRSMTIPSQVHKTPTFPPRTTSCTVHDSLLSSTNIRSVITTITHNSYLVATSNIHAKNCLVTTSSTCTPSSILFNAPTKTKLVLFTIALMLCYTFNIADCLQYPVSQTETMNKAQQLYNRQSATRFALSQICPAKVQFPITKRVEGALLTSDSEAAANCTITFRTKVPHQHFVVRFEELNLGCDDHLKMIDGDLDYGQPSIKEFSCRDSLATTPIIKTTGSFLTLHYASEGRLTSSEGFRMVITAAFEATMWECPPDYAACRNNLCISRSLYCDEINHCLDNSDEDNCSKGVDEITSLGIITVILVLIAFLVIVMAMLFLYCKKSDKYMSDYQHQLQLSVPIPGSSSVMFNQYQYMPPNLSPYIEMPPQNRMVHGYSTLPINLSRQANKTPAMQPNIMNGPYVMMAGMPTQPIAMMMPIPQPSAGNDFSKFQTPGKPANHQPYNMVLMNSNANLNQQSSMYDSQL